MFIPARGNCLARRDPLHLCHPLVLTCYLPCLLACLCLCVSGCNKPIANIIPGPGQLSSCCCNPLHLCLPLLACLCACASLYISVSPCLLVLVLPCAPLSPLACTPMSAFCCPWACLQFIQSEDRQQCNAMNPCACVSE